MTAHGDFDLAGMRAAYINDGIEKATVHPDPVQQFSQWLAAATAAQLREPNAMILSTADADATPSARTVLLKGVDAGRFVFYTNYASRKARALADNPVCSLLFVWLPLARQVEVAGVAKQLPPEDSDRYFAGRPRGSQVGAWTSPQSQVIDTRAALDQRRREVEQRFKDGAIPRPPHWGGFAVEPHQFEFWQGRPDRLHDRLRYGLTAEDEWHIERLAP